MLLGEIEEVVENLLCELVVREQRPLHVGDDEFVGLFAVADRVRDVLIVLDEADDFELDLLAVIRLDNKNVAQFERTGYRVVCRFDEGLPIGSRLRRPRLDGGLMQVACDVGFVFCKRLCEGVMAVTSIHVVEKRRGFRMECRE